MTPFPKTYRVLTKNEFVMSNYKLIPIRYEDRMLIMKWRNEQIYHLRQAKLLTEPDQENYFNNVVSKLFEQEKPGQILFSYLENDVCIGYGGLVHINWIDKHAELSFIINTELDKKEFHKHWGIYLDLIEQVAFGELKLHKLFTYAFDLRPHLYEAIEAKGYEKEAVLKEHCFFNGEFKDVIIHSKIDRKL
ncbi:MAG: GNAT family N-acetyltransferase [Bacteroidetes bacterium]|nr:GNAT family N-acetyltransferase [Bacteroidota bacterium]